MLFTRPKSLVLVTLALLGGFTTAHDAHKRWRPAGPGDVRSPCPGMNLMANHGIIPHDGKNLRVPQLTQVMMDVFNFDYDLANFFANFGLSHSKDPDSGAFTLEDLQKHNSIEHDASLSRMDYAVTGDCTSFSWDAWGSVLKYFKHDEYVTVESAALARQHREQTEAKRDGNFTFDGTLRHNSFSESAIYLSALGSPIEGKAKTKYVREFFEKERLPTRFGWKKTQPATSFKTLDGLIEKIANVTGDDSGENPAPGGR